MASHHTLRINRVDCDGYGHCAELLPELIGLDEWGYPVLRSTEIPDVLLDHARRTVAACPLLALRLDRVPPAQTRTV